MKILVVGTGFVGLTHAAVLSEYGHYVWAYDIDKNKIEAFKTGKKEKIEFYVNEEGLYEVISETLNRYLFFSHNLEKAIKDADAVFMCVPTPPNPDGSTNLSYYDSAAEDIAKILSKNPPSKRMVIVNKSTVPIGTARRLQKILEKYNVKNVGVASNPEFLPEGDAVQLSRKPDRVVVGADSEEDFKILRRVYSQFYNHVRIKYIETSPETAESIKYISNTLLLTYISFWNGVGARVAEKMNNVNMEKLKIGVTADYRIATWGSYVSNGAGGSCFGKDIQSLIYQLKSKGADTTLLEAVYNINEYQKTYLIDRAVEEAGFNFNGKTIALLGLAFKQRTNDMRDASSIKVVEALLGKGVKEIRAYDPLAIHEAKKIFDPAKNSLFEKIKYFDSSKDAITTSDALFISTDWEEFRGLSYFIEETVNPPYLIIDGRRMIPDYEMLVEKGYDYLAVGSPFLKGK